MTDWLKNNWQRILLFIALALLGIWIFDSLFGAAAGAVAMAPRTREKIADSKGRSQAADQRQAHHEKKAEAIKNEAAEIERDRKEVKVDHTKDDFDDFLKNNSADKHI